MTAQLMPWAISRETDATNLPLSGGKVYTYQAGTTTPYPTWADADQTIPNANPVILDAGGFHPIFLDPAQAYDIEIQDSAGAQVVPVFHNIRLSQASSSVTNTLGIFANYDALRNQVGTAYAVAIVLGRTSAGDGGYGIFWKMATSPWVDDDGSVLANGANVYARQTDYLDPLWFGAVYSLAANQVAAISHAAIASAARAVPVVVSGSLFLQSGFGFPSGAAVKFVLPGKLTSNVAVSVTFADGAQLVDAATGCFAGEVQPSFAGPIREVRSSWFANVSGDRVAAKWLGCASTLTRAVLDSAITGLTTLTASALYDIDVEGGSLVFQNATGGALNLARVIYDGRAKWIGGPVSSTYLATASAGSPVRPEWFGAYGNGSTDDFYALANVSIFGAVKFHAGAVYLCTLGNVLASRIECDGSAPAELRFSAGRVLAATNLRISGIIVSGDANCVQASTLFARDCTFPSGYVASVSADIDGCTFTGDSRTPVSAGKPALYNPHLPLILSADTLATDANGKIYGKTLDEYEANWNINALTTVGGTVNATRGFGETPTQLIKSDGTASFWVRDKFNSFAAWELITPNIPYAYTNQRTIEFVWYAGGAWYAATSCANGIDFHAEIFRSADATGINSWSLLSTAPAATQYYQQWTGFRQLADGTVYITKGALNDYVYGQIYKVLGTSVTVIPYGLNTTNLNVLALDEASGFLYLSAQFYDYTGLFLLRLKLSDDTVVNASSVGILQCMAFLGTGDTAITGVGTGNLSYISNLKSIPFAPVSSGSWQSFNMNAIRTMVNAGYTIAAGGDGGLIGITQSADIWKPALGTGGGNNRYFSRRMSGVEGLTYNTVAYNFVCSYYVAATGETLLGGTGSSVINRY